MLKSYGGRLVTGPDQLQAEEQALVQYQAGHLKLLVAFPDRAVANSFGEDNEMGLLRVFREGVFATHLPVGQSKSA